MKKKASSKLAGPPTVAAYEFTADGVSETIRIDNLRAVFGETEAQATARATRKGWARKALLDWLKLPVGQGPTIVRVMTDGTRAPALMAEARDALDNPEATPIAAMIPAAAPTVAAAPVKTPRKRNDHNPDTCGCDACVNARDVKRGVAEPMTALAVVPRAEVKAEIMPEIPTHDPLSGLSRSVYTIGYAFGLTPEHLDRLLAALDIATVIDTRVNTLARKGWSGQKLRERLGVRYRSAQTLTDVAAHLEALAPSPSHAVLLLRKETAPGDNQFHLDIAKRVKVTHLWMAEMVDGAALQKALDADAIDPTVDHEYECVALVSDEEAPQQASA